MFHIFPYSEHVGDLEVSEANKSIDNLIIDIANDIIPELYDNVDFTPVTVRKHQVQPAPQTDLSIMPIKEALHMHHTYFICSTNYHHMG